jgi:hypothetical protein
MVVGGSVDQRYDDLLGRETSLQERQVYNVSVAYGLTSWLSLQLDVGRYSGDVTNFDTFRVDRRYVDLDNSLTYTANESLLTPFKDASMPISAGTLEQVPVLFSAVFRFRKDSPFNPILGAGVGMIFTDFEESGALKDLNQEILRGFRRTQMLLGTAYNTQRIEDRYGNVLGDTNCTVPANSIYFLPQFACALGQKQLEAFLADPTLDDETKEALVALLTPAINEGFIPRRPFITTEVEDAFEYHFMGGAEYHFNENWSAYVVGRYTFTRASFRIRISDNGNVVTAAHTPDRSQAIRFETDQAKFIYLAEANCDDVAVGERSCVVYPDLLRDEITVQGGEINLSGLTLGFGLRYSF